MKSIELTSETFTITGIKDKTNSKILSNFSINDNIKFSTYLKLNGLYENYITLTNIKTGKESLISLSELHEIFNMFEFKEKDKEDLSDYYKAISIMANQETHDTQCAIHTLDKIIKEKEKNKNLNQN